MTFLSYTIWHFKCLFNRHMHRRYVPRVHKYCSSSQWLGCPCKLQNQTINYGKSLKFKLALTANFFSIFIQCKIDSQSVFILRRFVAWICTMMMMMKPQKSVTNLTLYNRRRLDCVLEGHRPQNIILWLSSRIYIFLSAGMLSNFSSSSKSFKVETNLTQNENALLGLGILAGDILIAHKVHSIS